MGRRLAALDVGDKRIGVAVSDALRLTARPVGTVHRRSMAADCASIQALLAEFDIEKVVAGLPLNPRGEEGEQADRVRHFCERFVRETGRELVYEDESHSTQEANRLMIDAGKDRRRRKEGRDEVAAAVILQRWMESHPQS